jgi:hypothetical protein
MSLRDAYQQKLQAQFQEQKAKLDLLRARAKRAAAQGKILAYEELSGADQHLAQAKAKLKTLADVGGSAVSELKSGISRAYSDLKIASKRAAEHLRSNGSAPPAAKPKKVRASNTGQGLVELAPPVAKTRKVEAVKIRPSGRSHRAAAGAGH